MITFPDVSNHEGGLALTGAVAVIAKGTEGTTFHDAWFHNFQAQAAQLGIPFAGYHWLNTTDLNAQAANAFGFMGASVPIMIDAEADGATVDRIATFTTIYRGYGGRCTMVYLPHWWWQGHLGSPSLQPLIDLGLALVSSNYSDPVALWQPYGGMTPTIGQYTDNQPFNGYAVDFNRFPGTIGELRNVFVNGVTVALTPDDIHAVAEAVWAKMIYSPSLNYNQPAAEWLKYTIDNNRAIAALTAKVDQLLAQPPAAGVADHTHVPGGVSGGSNVTG